MSQETNKLIGIDSILSTSPAGNTVGGLKKFEGLHGTFTVNAETPGFTDLDYEPYKPGETTSGGSDLGHAIVQFIGYIINTLP